MGGDACLVQVQVHHEATGEHPPRQIGVCEVEHPVPGGPLGAEQLGNLDLDHDDDAVEDVTASNSARTADTTRPSTTPPATA